MNKHEVYFLPYYHIIIIFHNHLLIQNIVENKYVFKALINNAKGIQKG